jgi:hypothetical protein
MECAANHHILLTRRHHQRAGLRGRSRPASACLRRRQRTYRRYFASQDGHVFGADSGGTPLFDLDLDTQIDSYPALPADGVLIIGARNSILTSVG